MPISVLIPNALAISLFAIAVFIAVRALYLYFRARNPRLFILGLSMGLIALTAAADFVGSNVTSISLNTDWFLYIGQSVAFLFILLSLAGSSEEYLRGLMRWQIALSLLALVLLLLAPVLPDFPDPVVTKILLSGSRGLLSFIIFFYYVSAFMTKETRFSLLMSLSFFLISFGYFTIATQYSFLPSQGVFLDNVGDVIRLFGLITLFGAVVTG